MLSILRGHGGRDLRGCLFKFSVPCCSGPFLQMSVERQVAPGWPVRGCPDPVAIRENLHFCSWLRDFHWPVGAFSGQVSSLSACWQPFDNRDKVIIVLKRSLEEFLKGAPRHPVFLANGLHQGFFQMTGCPHWVCPSPFWCWRTDKRSHPRARPSHCLVWFLFLFFERRELLWERGPAFGESDFELWLFSYWATLYSMSFNTFEVHFHYLWNGAVHTMWGDREDMGLRDK